jgi:hypothetical protein
MFGLDWRSLALMRIGLAAVILADLAICAQHLTAFYTDNGVLPRTDLIALANPVFSLHLISGSWWWAAGLLTLEAASALMMLVGYRTKLATVLCWLLLVSRQARNPLLTFGADIVLRLAMFWAMFLPLNRRLSLDAALGRVRPPPEPSYLGAAGIGAIIQFLLIYVISGILKSGPAWRVDHTAVYYALSIDIYSRPLGHWLNQFDGVTAFLTVFTLYLEIYGPFLFILPLASAWGRLLGFALFAALQVGFAVTMQMGLFWPVMIAFNLMLLPAEFWTWWVEPASRSLAKRRPWVNLSAKLFPIGKIQPVGDSVLPPACGLVRRIGRRGAKLGGDACLLGVAALIVLYNIDTVPGHRPLLPARLSNLVETIGLDQYFNMFAPEPQTEDGWFVLRGWLQNGRNVDLRTGDYPASFVKPASVADTYGDERYASLLIDLTFDEFAPYREGYLRYLARQWNQQHPPAEQVKTVEMFFIQQINGPLHTESAPQVMLLWTESFNQ